MLPPEPPSPKRADPGWGSEVTGGDQLTERTCTMHSGAGAAPPSNTSTRSRGPCRFLYWGLIQVRQQVGVGVHAFSWGTLTED